MNRATSRSTYALTAVLIVTLLVTSLPEKAAAVKLGSLSLSQAYRIARSRNLDLKKLKLMARQAEVIRYRAWSLLKPILEVGASYTRYDQEIAFDISAGLPDSVRKLLPPESLKPTVIQPQNMLGMQVTLTWAPLNPQAIPIMRMAYLNAKALEKGAQHARRAVLFGVAGAYYGALMASAVVDIARQALANTREQLRIAQARHAAGQTPEVTVLHAKLGLQRARSTLVNAQNGDKLARLALATLMGYRSASFKVVRPPAPQLPSGNVAQLLRRAIGSRPDVKQARLAVAAARQKMTDVWMSFLPTVAVVGNVRGSNATGFGGESFSWSLMVAANWKLYGGGSRYSARRQAAIALRDAEIGLRKKRLAVSTEIRQARIKLSNNDTQLKLARAALGVARRNHKLTKALFKNGMATSVEISDANTRLVQAEVSVAQQSLSRDLAILGLRRAVWEFNPQ